MLELLQHTIPQPWRDISYGLFVAAIIITGYIIYQGQKLNIQSNPSQATAQNVLMAGIGLGFVGSLSVVMFVASLFQETYGKELWFYAALSLVGGIIVLASTFYFWNKHIGDYKKYNTG